MNALNQKDQESKNDLEKHKDSELAKVLRVKREALTMNYVYIKVLMHVLYNQD